MKSCGDCSVSLSFLGESRAAADNHDDDGGRAFFGPPPGGTAGLGLRGCTLEEEVLQRLPAPSKVMQHTSNSCGRKLQRVFEGLTAAGLGGVIVAAAPVGAFGPIGLMRRRHSPSRQQ